MLQRLLKTSHPFFELPLELSPATLMRMAGKARVKEAESWAARWSLSTHWLEAWATFALVIWDVARSCRVPSCRFGCEKMRQDPEFALQQVLSLPPMLLLGEPPLLVSILQSMGSDGDREAVSGSDAADEQASLEKHLPPHKRRITAPLAGPHPLIESKAGFLRRAEDAWNNTVEYLEKRGVSLQAPRKLDIHSMWLVRYQALGETAASIVGTLESTDPSTVYKAVKALARVIELPIRTDGA